MSPDKRTNVQALYSGPEGDLWELVMGEQIHVGGFPSSLDLAKPAGIVAGMHGIDLCCCTGAGLRFLVEFCGVVSMRGEDAAAEVVERGRQRCQALGLDQQITFTLADVCASGLPSPAALRLWHFLLTESERCRAARARGDKLVGAMKDLDTVPVLAHALPGLWAFYPDGAWWNRVDGPLHDYAWPSITSMAIVHGLVEPAEGREMLGRLWKKVWAVGLKRFGLGLPCTLVRFGGATTSASPCRMQWARTARACLASISTAAS